MRLMPLRFPGGERLGGGVFLKTVRSMHACDWALAVMIALCLGFCGAFGWAYGSNAWAVHDAASLILLIFSALVASCVAGVLLLICDAALTKLSFVSLNRGAREAAGMRGPSKLLRFLPSFTLKSIVAFAVIIIAFWSPYVIAAFPGTMYNDTAVQMQQVYEEAHPLSIRFGGDVAYDEADRHQAQLGVETDIGRSSEDRVTDAWLVDHHPFALTMLYGGVAKASDALFGSWVPGFALLMLCQVIAFALELSFAVAYLRRRGAPPVLCMVALLFFCIMPAIPLACVLVMKDCAFTLFFIPYFLMLAESVATKGAFFRRKRWVAALVVTAVLMCLTKKTGAYVVGATALFGLLCCLLHWRRAAAVGADASGNKASALAFLLQGALCALLMFVLVPAALFPLLGIVSGSKGEAMGIMLQQTARVYRDHGSEALTQQEREGVQGVMRVSGLEWSYLPWNVDKVKERFYLEASDDELRGYLGAYASMGARFSQSYVAALVSLEAGYLAPVKPYTGFIDNAGWQLSFDDDRTVLWQPEATAPLREGICAMVQAWDEVPVLDLLLRGVTYDLWVPLILLFFSLRNRLGAGILFVPFAITTAFCLIGPIYDLRYLFPEMFLAPVFLGFLVAHAKAVFKERAEDGRLSSKMAVAGASGKADAGGAQEAAQA